MKPCLGMIKPTLTLLTALLLSLLAGVLPAADSGVNGAAPPEILAPDELAFVRELATATLKTCGVAPGAIVGDKTNTLGFRAITPGGYPAIWVLDFTMNFSSGLIAREDGLRHFQLILEKQNGPEPRELGQQVVIPAHAIPDHVNVDGAPVFFPGTYDPLAHMNGDWGFRPPSNNQFEVISLAHMLARSGDAKALLSREVGGRTVYERLKLAFAVPEIDPATQLVRTTAARRSVGFIFYDAIEMTGDLLMASLIRYRAALHLAWLATKMDQPEDAEHYADIAQQIRSHILPVFADTDGTHGGWLKASNGISGQSDVWGSIYAIYIGAVEGEARAALLRTITAELAKPGEIEFEGALRHVPLSGDFSPTTMWEKARPQKNRYMNGAYWHVPVGWLLAILQPEYPELAQTIKRNWLGHLRAQQGKVWECIGWDGQANKNPSFGTSIALPLGVLSRGELRADRLAAPLAAVYAAEPASNLHPYVTAGDPNISRAFRIAVGDIASNVVPFQAAPISKNDWAKTSAQIIKIAGTADVTPSRMPVLGAGLDYPWLFQTDTGMHAWDGAGFLQSEAMTGALLATLKLDKDGDLLCGCGGSMSWGLTWTIGAWSHYLITGDRPFLKVALTATLSTLDHLERNEFDADKNLFRGPTIGGDGISNYPDVWAKSMPGVTHIGAWMEHNPDKKAAFGLGLPMHALSTQCSIYEGYLLAGKMQRELGMPVDPGLQEKARLLKEAINKHFWREDAGIYRFLVDPFGGSDQQEGLGNAMAVLFGVASPEQAQRMCASLHIAPQGIPWIWPPYPRYVTADPMAIAQRSDIWPLVNGPWSSAAAMSGRVDLFALELKKAADRACRDNQFAENYHPITGEIYGGIQEGRTGRKGAGLAAFVAARLGGTGEPTPEAIAKLFPAVEGKEGINHWPSCGRNTFSSTAYVRMVLQGLCGLQLGTDGITFKPTIPKGMSPVAVYELPYRQAELEIHITGEGNVVKKLTINGQEARSIPTTATGKQVVRIEMNDANN